MKMPMKILGRIGLYLLVAFIVFYAVFPFYWAIVSSLKTGSALFTSDLIPTSPTFENYIALFREQPFARNILNSAIVAIVTTAISLRLRTAVVLPAPIGPAKRITCSATSFLRALARRRNGARIRV